MVKHTRTSSQEAMLENLVGQTNQFQSDLDKLIMEICANNQKLDETSLRLEERMSKLVQVEVK
jgi:hypothetical protein